MKKILLSLLLLANICSAQLLYYTDRINGGYSFNSVQAGVATSSFTQSIPISVPSGSTERRTFLIADRVGAAPPLTITVQGQQFTFSPANQATPSYYTYYGGTGAVHVIDITGIFNININNFIFNIPPQSYSSNKYTSFAIYRSFLKAGVGTMNCLIALNTFNINTTVGAAWQINIAPPLNSISTASPVAVGLMCDYLCNCSPDGNAFKVNTTNISTANNQTGSNTPSTSQFYCGGPIGSNRYYGTSFTAFLTNNINQSVTICGDALSDISGIIANNATTFQVVTTMDNTNIDHTNIFWGLILGYHDNGVPTPYECTGCLDLTDTLRTPTSITLQWKVCVPEDTTDFINDVYFREIGAPAYTITTVDASNLGPGQTANSLAVTGLISGHHYEWYLVNVSNGGAICSPSQPVTFTTP